MAYITGSSDGTLFCTTCQVTIVVRDRRDLVQHEKQNPVRHPKKEKST